MPKISVIIPVYNTEKYLAECLDSVVNQTLQDIEIICVNDGSTDGSLAILEEYAEKDSRIKIIQQKNQGAGEARNKGIKTAQGEYIAFIDSDDFLEEDCFYEKLYNSAKSEQADISKANYKNLSDKYVPEFVNEMIKENKLNFTSTFCSCIFNRLFLINNNIFFPNLIDMEDPVFAFSCAIKANKIIIVDNLYIIIRQRTGSATFGIPSKKRIEAKILGLEKIIQIASQNNVPTEVYAYVCGFWFSMIFDGALRNKNIRTMKFYITKLKEIYAKDLSKNKQINHYIKTYFSDYLSFYNKTSFLSIISKIYLKTVLNWFFSLKNEISTHSKYKIVTILGLKFRIKKYNRKLSVIIPTMQKNTKILQKLLDNLQIDNIVDEIIIIDNSSKGFSQAFLSKYPKAKLIINKKNEFVNPCWNKGIKIAKNDYWALLNDDIIPPPNFCSGVLEILNPKIGIVGMDVDSVKDLCVEEVDNIHYSENKLIIEPAQERNYCFGIAMFGHKKSYYKIPKKIKVWFGDDYLFIKNQNSKKQNYIIKNINIYHCHSLTSNMTCFDEIKKQDDDGIFYALYKPSEKIFSIKNKGKHKVLTFFGLKLKVKRSVDISKLIFDKNLYGKTIKTATIFAMYDNYHYINKKTLNYLYELRRNTDVLILIADNPIVKSEISKIEEIVDVYSFKKHGEYDFGSYKRGLNIIEENPEIFKQLIILYFVMILLNTLVKI